MALSPLNLGRVSFSQQTNTLLESLRRSSMELLTQEARLASGRSLNAASEDPAKGARVLNLETALEQQGQVADSLRHASDFLDATEGVITELSTLLADAHAIASQNVGALASAEERTAAAELIADIVDQLVTIGNRQFNGMYLFAGRDTQSAPFVQVDGGVGFLGDTGDLLAGVDLEDTEPFNLTGDELFGALAGRVEGTVDLTPRLTTDTRLDEVRTAADTGLSLGQLVITQPAAGTRFTVDLTSADTMGDIIDLINNQAGDAVTAALDAEGITLTPLARAITVTDTGTGRTTEILGMLTPERADSPITGTGLRRLLTRTTAVADLAGGAGVDLSGGLQITNGTESATVDLSNAQTVQDILNAIDTAGLHVRARINDAGTALDVLNLVSGTSLSIAEKGGGTAAALKWRTLDLDTPLSALNAGRGVKTVEGENDLRITAKAGSTVDVNLEGAETIGDVIDTINAAASDAGVSISADLAQDGNGIRIVDSTGGTGELSVSRLSRSYAVDDLGLDVVPEAGATELLGRDVAAVRPDNVLTSLMDLERALRSDDELGITKAGERVYAFIDEVNRVQGVVGARAKAMQARQATNEAATLATGQLLSELRDLDYAEAATRFQLAQTALQATLTAGSQSLNLSLLDFLE